MGVSRGGAPRPGGARICVDVGSTFTKAAAIGPAGEVLALAQHVTTSSTDVVAGLDAAVGALGMGPVPDAEVLVCSSAGGGLRLAVVGHERVISAEAGRRVALSAGARVVGVSAGMLDPGALAELRAASPDVLLVVGGTDGGDAEVLMHNCAALGRSELACPVVLAGNAAAADGAARLLARGDRVTLVADNVIPRIGVLHPGPARRAIREVFITHVIGGKGLSRGARFADLVVAATPDAVLAGIEVVAEVLGQRPGAHGDVMALDVGGATTDVYSVLSPDDEAPDRAVETLWHGRTVEGDLGMRWSAPDVVAAAIAERLVDPVASAPDGSTSLAEAALRRRDDVGFLPEDPDEVATDLELARLAAIVAARRHARPGPEDSRDLSRVGVLIGSGGVLRHSDPTRARGVLEAVLGDSAGGWRRPEHARVAVDARYLLAPIGLLALTGSDEMARALAGALLDR